MIFGRWPRFLPAAEVLQSVHRRITLQHRTTHDPRTTTTRITSEPQDRSWSATTKLQSKLPADQLVARERATGLFGGGGAARNWNQSGGWGQMAEDNAERDSCKTSRRTRCAWTSQVVDTRDLPGVVFANKQDGQNLFDQCELTSEQPRSPIRNPAKDYGQEVSVVAEEGIQWEGVVGNLADHPWAEKPAQRRHKLSASFPTWFSTIHRCGRIITGDSFRPSWKYFAFRFFSEVFIKYICWDDPQHGVKQRYV